MVEKLKVLVLCTANSARSQMGEGLLREMGGDRIDVFSAGSEPSTVNQYAIAVMNEIGIDISGQRSKHLNEFLNTAFDYVITVCDNAAKNCPYFPGKAVHIHWGLVDPAGVGDTEEDIYAAFRETRDQLFAHFAEWLKEI